MTEARRWTKEEQEREIADAVVASFPEVSIHEMRDSPDADLLHREGHHVGMEIVRLADERELGLQARFGAVTASLRRELVARRVLGTFWVYFDTQQMFDQTNKRAWDRSVPAKLADLLRARAVTLDADELVAAGVTCIARVEVDPASDTFVGCGWRTSTKAGDSLAEVQLASKHQKLARYRAENGDRFKFYWLAIASFGPGTVEDGGYGLLLESQFKTIYDRVLFVEHGMNGRMVGARDVTPPTLK